MAGKSLRLSSSDKKIAGVCGGMAAYFGIDSTLVRVLWVLATVFTAGIGGVIAYALCAVIIPKR